jgi:hypothetical protein
MSARSQAATKASTSCRRPSGPRASSSACWEGCGTRSSTALRARWRALFTAAGLVSRMPATSAAEKPRTSRRISTARWVAG